VAIAAAISRFGFDPGAALATVVGVLIEVPVVLLVVHVVDRSRDGCEQRRSPARGSPSDRQVCRQSPAHDYAP
jgi:ACR3 family arsenite transporter